MKQIMEAQKLQQSQTQSQG